MQAPSNTQGKKGSTSMTASWRKKNHRNCISAKFCRSSKNNMWVFRKWTRIWLVLPLWGVLAVVQHQRLIPKKYEIISGWQSSRWWSSLPIDKTNNKLQFCSKRWMNSIIIAQATKLKLKIQTMQRKILIRFAFWPCKFVFDSKTLMCDWFICTFVVSQKQAAKKSGTTIL